MKGATGWVGSPVVEDLIRAGHKMTDLARSSDKAAALATTFRVLTGFLLREARCTLTVQTVANVF